MLVLKHVELKDANEFIEAYHRHHKSVIGHRFSLGAYDGEKLCGVAIVGRPKAREIDYKKTVEVTRLCTDGTPNACSFLYAACRRCAKELGYERIITYILESENGTSLKAAGWNCSYVTKGGSWDTPSRRRTGKYLLEAKKLFEAILR